MRRAPPDATSRVLPLIQDTYSIAAAIADGTQSWLLKTEDLFCVLDDRGDVAGPRHAGLYFRDTRFVSGFSLAVNGDPPSVVTTSLDEDNTTLTVELSCSIPDRSGSPCTLSITRTSYLSGDALYSRIEFCNDGTLPVEVPIAYTIDADFSDIFEVRGDTVRHERGNLDVKTAKDGVSFDYLGRDGIERCARFEFAPIPESTSATGVEQLLSIPPGESMCTFTRINCEPGGATLGAGTFSAELRDVRQARQSRLKHAVGITADDARFNALLARSLADLYMLTTKTDTGLYPYAGLPWFCAPFGRDGIIAALQTLWMDPSIARGVLGFLAKTQAREVSREHDAEPGKILHEARMGELANTGAVPFKRYYGSVDATPLFVFLAGEYLQRTGDRDFISGIWPAIEDALHWIDRKSDGFLAYERMTEKGLANQGWKDSVDSVFHADGSLAEGPIALCEVQGYVYAARRGAARMATVIGKDELASALLARAKSLKADFEKQFWSHDLHAYVLALDGDGRQCAVRASNAGHLLLTEIAEPGRADALAGLLCGPSFFSGWGIRTVADTEAAYDALSYHNGSVWPHDTSLIAMGLARYGLTERIGALLEAMLDASTGFDMQRLPELFSGEQRDGAAPVPFSHACAPQAWSAAAPLAMLGAILGIGFDAQNNRVTFRNTRLPPSLATLTLRGFGIGEATADMTVEADGDGFAITVENVRGNIEFAAIDSPGLRISILS